MKRGATRSASILGLLGSLVALYFLSRYNYLLFHGLLETTSVVVGAMLFTVAARMYGSTGTAFLMLLGIGFFWAGVIDLVHMLAYKGMGVFSADGSNLPTQLWVLARYIQVAVVVAATLFLRRSLKSWWPAFALVGAITGAGLALVFLGVFPTSYVEGSGLTEFKKVSEYIISVLWVVALVLMLVQRRRLGSWTTRWLTLAMVCTVGSEVAFTFYVNVYGLSNFAGHILKLVAYCAVLAVIIRVMLTSMQQELEERRRVEAALLESEEQLRQSQKMEAVGRLAGGIAHDFNNLLTVILGYCEILLANEERSIGERKKELLQIQSSAERAAALTKQILAFSRRQTLQPVVASLNDIIADLEPLLRRTLGEDIDLRCRLQPDLGRVEVDVHQFEQVIMNLAVNSRDAMEQGGCLTLDTSNVELDEEYCRAHPEVTPGPYVMLAVSDTGIGMDTTTLQRAFEPFFTTKAPGVGTGLGLATVYGIVKQSNGVISVYSEPGSGTCFKIYLPRVRTAADMEASTSLEDALGAKVAIVTGHETILVVEDDASVRELMERVLEARGYRVLVASSGEEALRRFAVDGQTPDLLLTDVVLPGAIQGHDLACSLLERRPELPVLYVSGYTRNAVLHAGRLQQGVNLLEKPFTVAKLLEAVRAALDRRRS